MNQKVVGVIILLVLCGGLILIGRALGFRGSSAQAKKPSAMPDKVTVLCCWYIVHDDVGEGGYACANGRFSYHPPAGQYGIVSSISELVSKIPSWREQGDDGISIIPTFGGHVPSGWEIRDLTSDEKETLRSVAFVQDVPARLQTKVVPRPRSISEPAANMAKE